MRLVKYIVLAGVVLFVVSQSVYFKKLDEVKAAESAASFNAARYAETFWNNKLMPAIPGAINLSKLSAMLVKNPEDAFGHYSHALGIGNIRYFLVSDSGIVESVNDDDVRVRLLSGNGGQFVRINTEYIFGNAARDATGLIDINDFSNTMDFNNLSAEINKIIREKVLPPFKQKVHKGMRIEFTGAMELNKEHLNLSSLELIPVRISE